MSVGLSVGALPEFELKPREFARIRDMAYRFCGVDLEGKQILVSSRLGKRIRQLGCASFDAYCDRVETDPTGEAFTEMIDALTTNHTSFFREAQHFEFLEETVVPSLPGDSALAIWSAACSSGEEPYSIAFALLASLGESALRRVSITASDISTRVLRVAAQGIYPITSTTSFDQALLRRCMLKGTGEHAHQYRVKREIREMVKFQQLNLLHDCSSVGPFHVVFCRNVMIYFDRQTQQSVVDHLVSRLYPGGYLFIGHAESLTGVEHGLTYVRSATYRKPGSWPNKSDSDRKQSAGGRA